MDKTETLKRLNQVCGEIPDCDDKSIPLCRECGKIGKMFEYCTDEEILRLSKTLNTPGEDDYRVTDLSDFCDNQGLCATCPIKCSDYTNDDCTNADSFDEMDEALIDDLYERLSSLGKSKPNTADDVNKENDMVDNPEHYTFGGIETVDYLRAKLTKEEFVGWCRGNALKYLSRAGHKDEELQEYRKAAKYIEWIIDAMKE